MQQNQEAPLGVWGRIHSLESFGTVDGPGIRFVIFMQGCLLRCLYCHNPDTWDLHAPAKYNMTPEELLAEVKKYESFIKSGGVTVTGGEPLLQPEFLKEFFKLCQQEGIHTALDTSGVVNTKEALEVLQYTDLVLLDIKTLNQDLCKKLTGASIDNTLKFLNYLEEHNIKTWVRHVIVPGLTDNDEDLKHLSDFLSGYKMVEKVELLPYHTMGANKYDQLGVTYSLADVEPLSKERLDNAKRIFGQE